ncbi:MAG: hypothetical protein K2X27_00690 [Candidatus Obscuribacterales bacterium]|nr:hypothetical protein [Candidatus Obscuribacterales bacterium]
MSLKVKAVVAFACTVIFLGQAAFSQDSNLQGSAGNPLQGNAGSTMLFGGVKHEAKLPALNRSLKPGNQFKYDTFNNDKALQGKVDSSRLEAKVNFEEQKWYRIPAWLAGNVWHHDQQTDYYYKDMSSGREDRRVQTSTSIGEETHGWEQDARGDFWAYDDRPFTKQLDRGDRYEYTHEKFRETLNLSADRFIERSIAVHTIVDKGSNTIQRSYQTEQILTTVPLASGQVRTDYSAKIFDMDGTALSLTKFYVISNRLKPFINIYIWKEINWRDKFIEWLEARGMADRIPKE